MGSHLRSVGPGETPPQNPTDRAKEMAVRHIETQRLELSSRLGVKSASLRPLLTEKIQGTFKNPFLGARVSEEASYSGFNALLTGQDPDFLPSMLWGD